MAGPCGLADALVSTVDKPESKASRKTARQLARDRVALERELSAHGTGFEFVQATRLLMRLYPEKASIGGWDDPSREVVRYSVPPSLAFPPSEIAKLELPTMPADAGEKPKTAAQAAAAASASPTSQARMSVRFLGVTGPQGVLPHVYTAHAASRARARDTAFRDFLDMFHHRVLSLFYRAWERHHPMVSAERGAEDRLRAHLLDFVGAGTAGVRAQSVVGADTLAYYAGLLALRTRPAIGLAQLIADHFRVPTTVEQFVGEWQPLRHGGQCALGDDGFDGQLGAAVIGDAVYDPLAKVRLRLGPLTRAQFDAFLPGGVSHESLRQLARLYADDQVGVEAQLVLRRDEIPGATLGTPGSPALGFGSWLRAKPPARDADDVRLTLC